MSDHIWDFIGHVFEQILVGQCLMTNSYSQPWTQVNTQTTHQQQNITLSSFVDCFNKIMNYFDIRIKLNPSLWNSSVQRMPKGKGSGWRMRKRQKKNRNIILLVFMSDFATRQLYTAQNIHVHVLSIIYHSLPTIAANKIYMYYQQQSTIMSVFNVCDVKVTCKQLTIAEINIFI